MPVPSLPEGNLPSLPRVAFGPTIHYPEQLRPQPQSVACRDGRASVCISTYQPAAPTLTLQLDNLGWSGSVDLTPELARRLAAQLQSAAEVFELIGGAR